MNKRAVWMQPGQFYHLDPKSDWIAGYWFYAQNVLKNGSMQGIMVVWDIGRRAPAKGKLQSVDSTWARNWNLVKSIEVPVPVMTKMNATGRMAAFDPKDIGKVKSPKTDSDEIRYVKDTDQRWFSEVQDEYPSDGAVWDGTDYIPPQEQVRRVTARFVTSQRATRVGKLARRWLVANRAT